EFRRVLFRSREGRQRGHLEPRSPRSRSRWACTARRTRASVRSCLRPRRRPPARPRNAASDCPPPADRYPCASSQDQPRGYACRSWLLPVFLGGDSARDERQSPLVVDVALVTPAVGWSGEGVPDVLVRVGRNRGSLGVERHDAASWFQAEVLLNSLPDRGGVDLPQPILGVGVRPIASGQNFVHERAQDVALGHDRGLVERAAPGAPVARLVVAVLAVAADAGAHRNSLPSRARPRCRATMTHASTNSGQNAHAGRLIAATPP